MTTPLLAPVQNPALPVGSPLWWVNRLQGQLNKRQPQIDVWQRYVLGDHDDPMIEAKASQAFLHLLGLSKTNITGLIVEAAAGRLGVQGFQFGDSPDGDADAWEIWQRSDFDAESALLFKAALTCGRSFVLVEPPRAGNPFPTLYAESATQMIVAYESGRRANRLAALKVWADEWTGDKLATLYLPDSIHKYRGRGQGFLWELRNPEVELEPNPLGVVPVFELRNRPLLNGDVYSEVADVIGDQDALNDVRLDALVCSKYGAFTQKYVTGMVVPRVQDPRFPDDPTKTIPVEPFTFGPNRIAIAEDPEVKFGSFPATDMTPYIDLGTQIVEHMAAVSQTPIGMLRPVSNVSADAMALSISGLVNKVQDRQRHYEQAMESALRLCFKAVGDPRADAAKARTLWVNPEIESSAQKADAAVKLAGGAVSLIARQTAQEKYLGMSETERDRDQAWREEGDAVSALTAVLSAPANPAVP